MVIIDWESTELSFGREQTAQNTVTVVFEDMEDL